MTNHAVHLGIEGLSINKMEFENIVWICDSIIENGSSWPIDKVARWIGYIQATMIITGLTSVDAERDFSRPLFHEAYGEEGLDIPPTREQ